MRTERQETPAKRALILFPTGRFGQKVVRTFAGNGYQVGVVELEGSRSASRLEEGTGDVHVLSVGLPGGGFWDNLPPKARELLLNAPVVIYHAATDFLRLRSFGKNEEWRVDSADEAQRRFAVVEELVSRRKAHPPRLWVNLAIGVTGVHGKKGSYCRTRYGLLGFTQILHMDPAFREMPVRNICLSYFKDFRKGHNLEQCANCTTRELRDTLVTWNDEDDLIRYLLGESEAALTRWPTSLP